MQHEGLRRKPYLDTEGKLTVGYGRNLDDVGITRGEAGNLLDHDISKAVRSIMDDPALYWVSDQPAEVISVIIEMVFNMGLGGFRKFRKIIAALKARDYETAAAEALDSKWYNQVGERAETLAAIIKQAKP